MLKSNENTTTPAVATTSTTSTNKVESQPHKLDKLNQEIESSRKELKELKNASSNEDILNKEFQIQSPVADTDLASIVNHLEELNLHNCALTNLDVESFKNLINLKKLVLSFNNLKHIKEIVHLPSLEYLDVSYNQIETMSGIKVALRVNHLNLSENHLGDILSLYACLKQYFQSLHQLNLTNNLFKRVILIFNF